MYKLFNKTNFSTKFHLTSESIVIFKSSVYFTSFTSYLWDSYDSQAEHLCVCKESLRSSNAAVTTKQSTVRVMIFKQCKMLRELLLWSPNLKAKQAVDVFAQKSLIGREVVMSFLNSTLYKLNI